MLHIRSCNDVIINLPTAFWGLLGPQKEVNVNFTKNRKQVDDHWPGQRSPLGSQKTPNVKMC